MDDYKLSERGVVGLQNLGNTVCMQLLKCYNCEGVRVCAYVIIIPVVW